jgi:spermidine/putrescine transport system ATP-binding protein
VTEPATSSAERATSSSVPVVELAGVTKVYPQGTVLAVAEADLAIRAGEFFSILGPSGSGKTTTLRMIAGFERPSLGKVLLDGADVTRIPPFRRDVSTVFQNYALFPHMRVEQNVAYPLRMRKVARHQIRRRVAEMLDVVAMRGYERRLPHQLSGGQRQRIALARALISQPKVLLLDEPLGALDLKLRQQMQLVLKNLQRDVGITFLYVTHDQGEALAMSDRLAVMQDGRIHQIGTPQEVYFRPGSAFVAGFIGKANLIECEIDSRGDEAIARAGDLVFAVRGRHRSGPATVSIRPEALIMGDHADSNRIAGVVEDVVFLGDAHEIRVAAAGQIVVAKVGAESARGISKGSRVVLSFAAADAVIVGE